MKNQVPEPIKDAISALLAAYGESFESLCDSDSNTEETRYLSLEASCLYTSVSKWTISRAVSSGMLRQIKLSSTKQGKILFDRTDLDNWMKKLKSK
jgi:predicted DNA-binding transcriptional regulator AlpA